MKIKPTILGPLEAATPVLLGLGLKDRWGGRDPGQDRPRAEGSGPPCWTPPQGLALASLWAPHIVSYCPILLFPRYSSFPLIPQLIPSFPIIKLVFNM